MKNNPFRTLDTRSRVDEAPLLFYGRKIKREEHFHIKIIRCVEEKFSSNAINQEFLHRGGDNYKDERGLQT